MILLMLQLILIIITRPLLFTSFFNIWNIWQNDCCQCSKQHQQQKKDCPREENEQKSIIADKIDNKNMKLRTRINAKIKKNKNKQRKVRMIWHCWPKIFKLSEPCSLPWNKKKDTNKQASCEDSKKPNSHSRSFYYDSRQFNSFSCHFVFLLLFFW